MRDSYKRALDKLVIVTNCGDSAFSFLTSHLSIICSSVLYAML